MPVKGCRTLTFFMRCTVHVVCQVSLKAEACCLSVKHLPNRYKWNFFTSNTHMRSLLIQSEHITSPLVSMQKQWVARSHLASGVTRQPQFHRAMHHRPAAASSVDQNALVHLRTPAASLRLERLSPSLHSISTGCSG